MNLLVDDKYRNNARDNSHIDVNDSNIVKAVAKEFGVTTTRLLKAIESVGNNRDKVKQYLNDTRTGFIWVK